IIKVDALDHVIEELAKEQHKAVLRQLTKGEFDERIVELGIPLGGSVGQPAGKSATTQPISNKSEAETSSLENPQPNTPSPEPVTIIEEPIVDRFNQPKVTNEPSLDDLIYDYLTAGQNQ
ncbi:MAG: hypothetical protein QNK27_04925, partial [Desulfuromusa sp.]|nr:hypothetical protein [Desulfuromusa sp.]